MENYIGFNELEVSRSRSRDNEKTLENSIYNIPLNGYTNPLNV